MTHRVIGFADGENLVLRYQDMIREGAVPKHDVVHHKDLLVWHSGITNLYYCDITRISFYQTAIGDSDRLNEIRRKIAEIKYDYNSTPADNGIGYLQPKVFKKENRSSKTKSVDINLTVDMLRHGINGNFDALLLLSGDGDYLPLVEEVARHGKQIWIGSFSKGLNQELRFAADQFIDLDPILFQRVSSKNNNKS